MDKNKIQDLLIHCVDEKQVSCISSAFIEKNKIEYFTYGKMGCIEPYCSIDCKENNIFDLASLTKVIATTPRILQLIENKQICLDTRVQEILPCFKHAKVTIEQLLLHQSGLKADLPHKENLSVESIQKQVYEMELTQQNVYSDCNYLLLGWIIEAIDQTSLAETMKKHIFDPLEMTDTSYGCKEKKRCVPTEITLKRGCICGEIHDSKGYVTQGCGSAGLFSTTHDLSKFMISILNRDEKILKNTTIDQMLRVRGERTYGWIRLADSVFTHTGFTGTSIIFDLHTKEALILLSNRIHPTRNNTLFLETREKINQIFLGRTK